MENSIQSLANAGIMGCKEYLIREGLNRENERKIEEILENSL